jgi:hypothetical protein
VTSAPRLAAIVTALEGVGLSCLVMGGHAVRYYGIERNTIDFDLHLSPDQWDELPSLLGRSTLGGPGLVEGPSWRPQAFRRFQVGRLPDGREEWLEFWSQNHLLPPFSDLYARREAGPYGGRILSFLSLPDLIRSKETERARDWQDISILEEFLDARWVAGLAAGTTEPVAALAGLRSRRGFESLLRQGLFNHRTQVEQAIKQAMLSVTQAYLLPFVPDLTELPAPTVPPEAIILKRLRSVAPSSPLHLSLVEVVRRQYMTAMQAADRADKEAIREAQASPPPAPA